jgi:hypothetical protein
MRRLGGRITENLNGTKTAYVHDGLKTLADYNGRNQLQRTYVAPGLDQNLSLTASGSTYYYLSGVLGSIRQVLDTDQSTRNRRERSDRRGRRPHSTNYQPLATHLHSSYT